jgi:hypothetical protein
MPLEFCQIVSLTAVEQKKMNQRWAGYDHRLEGRDLLRRVLSALVVLRGFHTQWQPRPNWFASSRKSMKSDRVWESDRHLVQSGRPGRIAAIISNRLSEVNVTLDSWFAGLVHQPDQRSPIRSPVLSANEYDDSTVPFPLCKFQEIIAIAANEHISRSGGVLKNFLIASGRIKNSGRRTTWFASSAREYEMSMGTSWSRRNFMPQTPSGAQSGDQSHLGDLRNRRGTRICGPW